MQIWATVTGVIGFGFYLIGQTNIEKNQQKMQERRVRYALAPFLQVKYRYYLTSE